VLSVETGGTNCIWWRPEAVGYFTILHARHISR